MWSFIVGEWMLFKLDELATILHCKPWMEQFRGTVEIVTATLFLLFVNLSLNVSFSDFIILWKKAHVYFISIGIKYQEENDMLLFKDRFGNWETKVGFILVSKEPFENTTQMRYSENCLKWIE